MKIKLALTSILVALSASSFADKVVITGEPIVLEEKAGVYVVPADYSTTNAYNYVTIGGVKSICYAEKQPNLASLDVKTVEVDMAGKRVQWNCYTYSDDYFTTAPATN